MAPADTPASTALSRLVDALDLAALSLERLAREQRTAATRHHVVEAEVYSSTAVPETVRTALATTRGEAARAHAALAVVLPNRHQAQVAAERGDALRSDEPIDYATLRTWGAGWTALAGGVS